MIKVLHVVGDSMSRAGMETFIMNIYRSIDTSKFQFEFLVHSDKKGDFDEEINRLGGKIHIMKVDRTKSYLVRNLKRYTNTYRLLKDNKDYAAIHIHTSAVTSFIELFVCYIVGFRKRIVHSHGVKTDRKLLHNLLYRFMVLFTTHRFACSEPAGKYMFGKNFQKLTNSKVINNGIIIKKFNYDIEKQMKIKRILGLENKLVVGQVARFEEVKNHNFIIDVFNEVHKENENAVLLLVGDGMLRKTIESKVETMSLSEHVKFTGVRTDIDELLLAIDVMLFPSFHEGLPVTLIEAQASGLKVLASDAVSKKANITGLITYMSLDESANKWAKVLLDEVNYERKGQVNTIKKMSYDIGGVADELCRVYKQ